MSLDDLLARAREPEPADDGFTTGVMARVRVTRSWRRFVTRPVVLAAAAVLIAGGALAAVRTVAPASRVAESPKTVASPPPAGLPRQTPARPIPTATAAPKPTPRPSPVRGDRGYTSDHTAYAVDRGLRLEAETRVNKIPVNTPHKVTVTLENLTDQPIALYAPRGCALAVAAYYGGRTLSSSERAPVWVCAGSNASPSTMQKDRAEPQKFVLEPHGRRTENATIVLDRPGDWFIVSQCICYERAASKPEPSATVQPTTSPLEGILETQRPSKEPSNRSPVPSSYSERKLVTPAIHIVAS
jgi:hypothetical protein